MINLGNGETLIGEYRLHWVTLLGWGPLLGLLFTFGLSLGLGLPAFLRYSTTRFYVTSNRFVSVTGVFAKDEDSIMRGRVESVEVDRHLTGRALGYGAVIVRGTGGRKLHLGLVADPGRMEADISFL